MLWPIIIFHIVVVKSEADFGEGFLSKIFSVGASVALITKHVSDWIYIDNARQYHGTYNARAANVSMIRLTQSNCTAFSTLLFLLFERADTQVTQTAVILTVIWNWMTLAGFFSIIHRAALQPT